MLVFFANRGKQYSRLISGSHTDATPSPRPCLSHSLSFPPAFDQTQRMLAKLQFLLIDTTQAVLRAFLL